MSSENGIVGIRRVLYTPNTTPIIPRSVSNYTIAWRNGSIITTRFLPSTVDKTGSVSLLLSLVRLSSGIAFQIHNAYVYDGLDYLLEGVDTDEG